MTFAASDFNDPIKAILDNCAVLVPYLQEYESPSWETMAGGVQTATWAKPAHALYVDFLICNHGGSGGEGGSDLSSGGAQGGGGGGGGSSGPRYTCRVPASLVPASLTVTFATLGISVTGTNFQIGSTTALDASGFSPDGRDGDVASETGSGGMPGLSVPKDHLYVVSGVGGYVRCSVDYSPGGRGSDGTKSSNPTVAGGNGAVGLGGAGGTGGASRQDHGGYGGKAGKGRGAGGGGGGGCQTVIGGSAFTGGSGGGGGGGYGGASLATDGSDAQDDSNSGGAGGIGAVGVVVITTWCGVDSR